ncbi:uncharacterized protein LOC121986743 [Zingiber officinale]|uniref:Uncharacterized protein n=1 Tax=Zingiber officinale TaxID=94328 RepID=A0A8J5GF80_ZINOF|nr:uncharacterized protein LOC121986743 [Zingiber officinale]KAG6503534.1 hypothetical protein ZIOFF_035849 [Zingiber officinale]
MDLKLTGSEKGRRLPSKAHLRALFAPCKNWAMQPMNMALMAWAFVVVAGLTVVLLFMSGGMDGAVPERSERTRWTEITNQILNALFTIMCIYQHPRLCHHLVLLCRWLPDDAAEVRKVYCKKNANAGARRSDGRGHMAFVVVLLHLTCLCQYGQCGLYWGYSSDDRPTWLQIFLMAVGILSPAVASAYVAFGPLESKLDEEFEISSSRRHERKEAVGREWAGGLFDCGDDHVGASLSLFCTCCVFGWNMERLGLGNKYVHAAEFVLLCFAPLLVFTTTASRIDDGVVKILMRVAGALLCFCGLLYGGFWRTKMRERFDLKGDPSCCRCSPTAADYLRWLLCWPCAVAQEVRTGNLYDGVEESRERDLEERSRSLAAPANGGAAGNGRYGDVTIDNDEEKDDSKAPPVQQLIQQEGDLRN